MNYFYKPSRYLLIAISAITLNCTDDSNESDVTTTSTTGKETETTVGVEDKDITQETVNNPNSNTSNNPTVVEENPIVVDNTNTTETIVDNQPNDNTNNQPMVRVLTAQEAAQLDFATFTIFDKTKRSPRTNLRKWTMSVNLFLSGDFGNKEIGFINDFSVELGDISNNIDLNIVSTKDQSNVEVYFATQEKFLRERPNFIEGYRPSSPTIRGRAQAYFSESTNIINRGLVWIDPSAKSLNSVVKHELLHLLGFGHTLESNSIMKSIPNVDPTLSNDDVFAVHTLYNDLIEANFLETELRNTVENNIESFFE